MKERVKTIKPESGC